MPLIFLVLRRAWLCRATGAWKKDVPATAVDDKIDIYSRPRTLVLDSLVGNQPEWHDNDEQDDDDNYNAYHSETGP